MELIILDLNKLKVFGFHEAYSNCTESDGT